MSETSAARLPGGLVATLTRVAPAAVLAAGLLIAGVAAARSADGEIIIRATAVEPPTLRAVVGQRVTFVRAVDSPVHVEFGEDPRQHHVVQVPVIGPIWAVFHRPGTHPYVVHIYGSKTVVLRGVVEVVEDPDRPWGPGTCGVVIMGDCIEP